MSKRALSTTLKQIHANPELLNACSRQSIKRAIVDAVHVDTDFGKLIRYVDIPFEDGSGHHSLVFIHPTSMLSTCAKRLPAYRELLTHQLLLNRNNHASPWHIVIYNDEVSPGNQLLSINERQTQAVYWAFREYGTTALTCEEIWFVLSCIRSEMVKRLGGMTVVLNYLAMSFFDKGADLSKGVLVNTDHGPAMFFAVLGILVSDESAIKHILDNKGASGILCCPICKNCVQDLQYKQGKRAVSIAGCDKTGKLVHYTETDINKFEKHTPKSLDKLLAFLMRESKKAKSEEFKDVQKHVGYNFKPDGILMNPNFGGRMLDMLMSDAQHVIFVNGMFNKEMGALLDTLKSNGYMPDAIRDHAEKVHWPSHCPATKAINKKLMHYRKKGEDFKCTASEGLSILKITKHFLYTHIVRNTNCSAVLRAAAVSFIALADVVARVQEASLGLGDPEELQAQIKKYLEYHLQVYGDSKWVSKFHASLHFGDMFERFKILITCWVLERKHKEVKRIANNFFNLSDTWETSLAEELLRKQFEELSSPGRFSPGVILQNARPASNELQVTIQDAVNAHGHEVLAGIEATTHGLTVKRGNAVKWLHDNESPVGGVCFQVSIGNAFYTCVEPLSFVNGRTYRVGGEPCLIDTWSIQNTFAYFLDGDVATLL